MADESGDAPNRVGQNATKMRPIGLIAYGLSEVNEENRGLFLH